MIDIEKATEAARKSLRRPPLIPINQNKFSKMTSWTNTNVNFESGMKIEGKIGDRYIFS